LEPAFVLFQASYRRSLPGLHPAAFESSRWFQVTPALSLGTPSSGAPLTAAANAPSPWQNFQSLFPSQEAKPALPCS